MDRQNLQFAQRQLTLVQPVIVVKTANETVNNSNTLQNDDHLFYTMAPNTSYFFELFMLVTAASGTADWKFGWSVPSSATMFWGSLSLPNDTGEGFGPTSTISVPQAVLTEGSTMAVGGSAQTYWMSLGGLVRNSTTSGNLQFKWAQNTATSENNTINKDSFMRITRLQ